MAANKLLAEQLWLPGGLQEKQNFTKRYHLEPKRGRINENYRLRPLLSGVRRLGVLLRLLFGLRPKVTVSRTRLEHSYRHLAASPDLRGGLRVRSGSL